MNDVSLIDERRDTVDLAIPVLFLDSRLRVSTSQDVLVVLIQLLFLVNDFLNVIRGSTFLPVEGSFIGVSESKVLYVDAIQFLVVIPTSDASRDDATVSSRFFMFKYSKPRITHFIFLLICLH